MLCVPDVAREADFYTSLMGMQSMLRKKDEIALGFGENTLVLRPSGNVRGRLLSLLFTLINDEVQSPLDDSRGCGVTALTADTPG